MTKDAVIAAEGDFRIRLNLLTMVFSVCVPWSRPARGNAVITRLNGVEVELTGNYCTMVVQHVDKKGTLAFVTTVLSAYDLNIGSLRLYRESRGKIAYAIIELDANVPEQVVNALKGIDAVINVLLVPAIHLD